MSVGLKIELARREKGWTQTEFAKKINISLRTIARWERGHTKPTTDDLQKIAQATEKPISYFLEDLSASKLTTEYKFKKRLSPTIIANLRSIPVISKVAAGDPKEVIDPYPPGYAEETILCPFDLKDPHAFALKIEGSSMSPRYLDGDYVIASPQRQPVNNRPVIAKVNDNEASCKLYKEAGNYIHLISVNPEFDVIVVHKKDVVWIYPVVGMYRREK